MNIVGVVLAAGLGTRLRPSTERCPKPLIPVGGIEPLYFAIHRFYELGIRRVVVNAHYLPEKISAAVKDWASKFSGLEIRLSLERDEILGTGGALIKIVQENEAWFERSALLLQNGDTLAQFDFSQLIQSLDQSTLAVSFNAEHLRRYNPLWVDAAAFWEGIGKTPISNQSRAAHFLGVHFLSRPAVKKLKEKTFDIRSIDLFNGIYRPLVNEGQSFLSIDFDFSHVGAKSSFWFDMTTQDYLLEAQKHVLESLAASDRWSKLLQHRYPNIKELSPGVWVLSNSLAKLRHFNSPAILVDSDRSGGNEHEVGDMTLGPHASYINEKGSIKSRADLKALFISNSVVLVQDSARGPIPDKVQNEVCVI